MASAAGEDLGARLQKVVEAITISPEAARESVGAYRRRFQKAHGRSPHTEKDLDGIAKKIIGRYATYCAAGGVTTALPGTIPGAGTIVATLGGGATDVALSLKLQIDMCMCLVELYDEDLSPEDKKHMAFILALGTTLEQLISTGAKEAAEVAAKRAVLRYLRGSTLTTIKQLFKTIGIKFTQKGASKLFPLGIGVVISGGANYGLTQLVGRVAISTLKDGSARPHR